MALSKAITTSHGLEIPNAYIRVDRLGGDKNNLDIKDTHKDIYAK